MPSNRTALTLFALIVAGSGATLPAAADPLPCNALCQSYLGQYAPQPQADLAEEDAVAAEAEGVSIPEPPGPPRRPARADRPADRRLTTLPPRRPVELRHAAMPVPVAAPTALPVAGDPAPPLEIEFPSLEHPPEAPPLEIAATQPSGSMPAPVEADVIVEPVPPAIVTVDP